jgi:NTE family protein
VIARPTVGLALSGGGIRGVTQVGVLKILEEENIPIDLIVGTSIGGVIGGLYASGYSPDEIVALARTTDWATVLSDTPQRSSLFLGEKEKRGRAILQVRMQHLKPVMPEAFSPGQMLHRTFTETLLNSYYHSMNFDELKVPLKIVATDMLSGEKVILDRGDLAQALRATVGIPLLFSPVEYGSYTLVDGGVVENIPVTDARNAGADIVIAVDSTSPLRLPENINAPWEIADQITTIMQQEKDQAQIDASDVAISFDDLRIVSTNFDEIDFLFQQGMQRTREQLPAIRAAIAKQRSAPDPENFVVNKISVSGSTLSFLEQFIDDQQKEWSSVDIQNVLEQIYNHGGIKNVEARIELMNEEYILHFDVTQNPPLQSIAFYGNSQFPTDSLLMIFAPLLDHPINQNNIRGAVERILKLYRSNGFSLAKIEKINFNEHDSSAHIYIFEGLVKEVHVSGLEKTRRFVVTREFDIKKGELFRFERAQKSLDNILATDLFSAVNLSVTSESIYHTVHLHCKEKPSHVLRVGARYDSERTAKIFSEFADENIFGSGNDLTFHIQYGGRDFRAFVDYRADQIFKSYLTSRFNLHHMESEHYYYKNMKSTGRYSRQVSGLNIELGQQISRFGTLSGHLRSENINIKTKDGFGYNTGSMAVSTIGMKTIIDTRDIVPFPVSGKHHIFFYEVSSGSMFGDDVSYYKVMNQLTTYTTYFDRHTFRPKLLWGTSGAGTPFSEQFRLGGQDSFFGLRQDQLWGKHMVLFSLDYRYMLPKFWTFNTYISARYDLGAMWAKMEEIKATDFVGGYGCELAFKTPLGPFSFAYGQTNKDHQQFYFTAGFEF